MDQTASVYHRGLAELVDKYRSVADCLPAGASVLELGCATGYFARALAAKGHLVVGVESDPASAQAGRAAGVDIRDADLAAGLPADIDIGQFDAVLAMDVLEHLPCPERLLGDLYARMKPGAQLLVTGPNVAHLTMRLHLLCGRWQYADTGILDRTHLRFYTLDGWIALVKAAGFTVAESNAAEVGPLPAHSVFSRLLGKARAHQVSAWLTQRFPRLFAVVVLVPAHKPL